MAEASKTRSGSWIGKRVDTQEAIKVNVRGGVIESVERFDRGAGETLPWISPGWIDLQVNGFGGYDFNGASTTDEDVVNIVKQLWANGVTTCLPTIITGSEERIHQALSALSQVCDSVQQVKESIAGFHLEGPYISEEDGPRGAHLRKYVRDPDLAEFAAWQEAAAGRIRMVTVAPERVGAIDFIARLAQQQIVPAIGHTAATTDELERAAEAGATMSTHLGNGSHTVLPRHPNYIWDQLADDRLWAGFIADGHHLPPHVLKVMLRAKQGKAILVSDAVAFAGMPPGKYSSVTNAEVELQANGRLHTAANPAILAGSASSLAAGVGNAARWGGVSLAEAIEMVTLRPAQVMRLDRLGRLDPGAVGNLTLFDYGPGDNQLRVRETVLAGLTVYSQERSSKQG